ncbi:cysteine hydrolase [Pseudanabaena sp. UWO310]|uniref:cysteine hydrolase n=1 Tax=Pseudanabaena sp. UWO310 TaxID=2480795 RepID=UPI0011582BAE|nr:cysteine hydrolase family protein [Pseudanabaena sp. UWO310]TYQ28502.1 cysteine hydrolase family protein [Pseudanabaena sp. UWO310]
MNAHNTALLLIGFQNDYFAPNGILHGIVEESSKVTNVLSNTIHLLDCLETTSVLIVETPIFFTSSYEEMVDPIGILKTIKEVGAFQGGTEGSKTIEELNRFKHRILRVPGKRGFNAFVNTNLNEILQQHAIENIVLAGTVTSVCIDSTGRSAHEQGYQVTILSDCTSARTVFEQSFYCENIFPLYANVVTHTELLSQLALSP